MSAVGSATTRMRSDYDYEIRDGVVCITDLERGSRSVTNDAESVVADLRAAGVDLDALRVIYRDSEGVWDEIVVRDGRFSDFRALRRRSLNDALRDVYLHAAVSRRKD